AGSPHSRNREKRDVGRWLRVYFCPERNVIDGSCPETLSDTSWVNFSLPLCMPYGTLYLIPVPLSDDAAAASYTPYLVQIINAIDEYIVENEKTARKFLKLAGLKRPQSELILHDYGKHARNREFVADYFAGLLTGKDVGLMSEAGCPGVAD